MANIKSAKKRALTNEKRRVVNVARKSELKTYTKKVLDALESNDIETAQAALLIAESKIARSAGKGVLKRNTAARKISRLAKKVAAATKPVATA